MARDNLYKNLHPSDLRFLINSRRDIRKRTTSVTNKNPHQPSDYSSLLDSVRAPCARLKSIANLERLEKSSKINTKAGDFIDIKSYLFPSPDDYLLRKTKEDSSDGFERVYADCLRGIKYVIVLSNSFEPDTDTFFVLEDVVPDLLADGRHDFAVVLVPSQDHDFRLYKDISAPFLVVPFNDSPRCLRLNRGMDFGLYSTFRIVDLEKAEVILKSDLALSHYGADFYPFTDERRKELDREARAMRRGLVPLPSLLRSQGSDVLHCAHHHPAGSCCGKQQSLSSLSNKNVGLFMLCTGDFVDEVLELYKLCKANNLELEIVLVCTKRGPGGQSVSSWQEYVDSVLENPDCCGWLQLPFDDRVCRRLEYGLLEGWGGDSLTIVGPNNAYIDPHGANVYHEYGIAAYPFTKQAVWDLHETRIRGFDLQNLLTSVGIHHLFRHDGSTIPISSVIHTNVLLFLGGDLSREPRWEPDLFQWYYELKKTSGIIPFEMIHVCLSSPKVEEAGSDPTKCRSGGWLSVPYNKDSKYGLLKLIYGNLMYSLCNALVAFGSDGRIRSVMVDSTLKRQFGPATFPESDENLHREVGVLLSYRSFEPWNYYFRRDLFSHVYCGPDRCVVLK